MKIDLSKIHMARPNVVVFIIMILMALLMSCESTQRNRGSYNKPNILLLVADDLGYADLGCFGSDISTPNVDQLAAEGILFTNFHSAPSCAPTRASLLSGTNNHVAGVGSQFRRLEDRWGYEGFLTNRVVTVPELLKSSGYQTYMTGKWHLGRGENQLPHSKGFERSFILQQGAANHYNNLGFVGPDNPSIYMLDGEKVQWPEDGYSTKVYTDYLIRFIKDGLKENKPFFGFAAYTSPHWPLQVSDQYWKKYRGNYDDGYEALRNSRLQSLKDAGIIPNEWKLPPMLPDINRWDSLTPVQQKRESRKMELYAGMVENLDHHIGRLVDYLKEIEEYENTFIIFMSDNGAAAEDFYNIGPFREFLRENYDNSYDNMGKPNSFVSYGPQWAEAGSAPFRYHKQYTYEGGIRTPMIIRYSSITDPGRISRAFATLTDLAPTIYELADVKYPEHFRGREIHPLQGRSLLPVLTGSEEQIHTAEEAWIMEHNHHALVRRGRWKLVNPQRGWNESAFELYDLIEDPQESVDVRDDHPIIYNELLGEWKTFQDRYKVQNFMDQE